MEQKRTITTRANQSVLDIALQAAGTIEAAFDIAEQNNLSITDLLQPRTEIVVTPSTVNEDNLAYYDKYKIMPASVDASRVYVGIGYWKIADDFKVQ